MGIRLTDTSEKLKERFFALEDAIDVASLLGIQYKRLKYHLYIVPPSRRYQTFEIPKRSGGIRLISAPATALKIIQRKLNQVLQAVYPRKPSAHGFVRGMSVVTNAQEHAKHKFVLRVDLKDFFPSIHFGRVWGMFQAVPYQRNRDVATVLAQICSSDQGLPQGAPTSPIISNMICAKMDSQLQRLAREHRCFYTRYGDDIVFSTFLSRFPPELATVDSSRRAECGHALEEVIEENGFEVNPNKVRLQFHSRRQAVTGLTVNRFPNLPRRYLNQIRAMLHAWKTYELEAAQQEFYTKYLRGYRNSSRPPPSFDAVVRGKIDFLGMVKGKADPSYVRFRRLFAELAGEPLVTPENPLEHLANRYAKLFDAANKQKRGFELQDLLNQAFKLSGFHATRSFTRNEGAEQIDGAFKFEGWHYLVECRWRKKLAYIRELDGLLGPIVRSGRQTMGFFLSIKGWSENVPRLLKENPAKCIILMNGDDLREVLSGTLTLRELIKRKAEALNLDGEPFYAASQYLAEKTTA